MCPACAWRLREFDCGWGVRKADRPFGPPSRRSPRGISSVTGRQLADLPNMIQPPLLGVVNAASAVSARTLTCRAPAVPRSCSMLLVYIAVRVRPVPQIAAARAERVRSLDPDIAGVEREGTAAF